LGRELLIAAHARCYAGYANDPRGTNETANARLFTNSSVSARKGVVWIEAIQDIKKGDVIWLEYGAPYWAQKEESKDGEEVA
jgi:hypothetical protein